MSDNGLYTLNNQRYEPIRNNHFVPQMVGYMNGGGVTRGLCIPEPLAMVAGTIPEIFNCTTPDNVEARSAEKIFFGWY